METKRERLRRERRGWRVTEAAFLAAPAAAAGPRDAFVRDAAEYIASLEAENEALRHHACFLEAALVQERALDAADFPARAVQGHSPAAPATPEQGHPSGRGRRGSWASPFSRAGDRSAEEGPPLDAAWVSFDPKILNAWHDGAPPPCMEGAPPSRGAGRGRDEAERRPARAEGGRRDSKRRKTE